MTILALGLVYRDLAVAVWHGHADLVREIEAVTLGILVTALVYGSLVYLFARDGYLRRRMSPRAFDELEHRYLERKDLPRLCVLIPSYKEEPRVVRQTVLSAALSIYGPRRIVVLIDDPVTGSTADLESLETCRALIRDLQGRFQSAAARIHGSYGDFLSRRQSGSLCASDEMRRVVALYDVVAEFVDGLAAVQAPSLCDRADEFLLARVINPCAERYRGRARALRGQGCGLDDVEREYQRLVGQLEVEITSFERKRFNNLSHAPNKAMNLNSYIGLLGKSLRIVETNGLPMLQECAPDEADLVVPDASYLLTLDADSMVLPDYPIKMVDIMERDSAVAVAQTPYSAIPGLANPLERAAGAQTDLQYFLHQGSTASNATFWVGANAVLRVSALRTIRTMTRERDFLVPVYIQDRTVIEDTGSTLDLIRYGWKLHNHPERLAYSATPPDFGSLIIQRRRWSNGGLIIFADLVRHALAGRGARPSLSELLLRTHYLCGPALTAFSVLLLLMLPFHGELQSGWLVATVLPYYALYARDARSLKYRWREVLHVYTLSLMLLPITLAGVLRSIQQLLTGRKSSFGRTPKTQDRTSMPAIHVVLQLALIFVVAAVAWRNALNGQLYFSVFWALNCALLVAGFAVFIGAKAAWRDVTNAVHWDWLAQHYRRLRGALQGGMSAPATDRIPGLDGIRAYAVILVFLVHFLSQYFNGFTGTRRIDFDAHDATQWHGLVDAVAHYFWASHYGVDLFFILSGFLIVRMIARWDFSYADFLRSRFVRLYPAFVVALGLHLLYAAAFWNKTYDAETIAANVALLHGITEFGIEPIIIPTWSLTYEWLFYLAFPAMLLLPRARERIWYPHLLICALLVLAVLVPLGPSYTRLLMFFAGAALAITPPAILRSLVARIPDTVIITVCVAANLVFVVNQNWYYFIPVFLVTGTALVAKAVYGTGMLHKLFCWTPLQRLGKISYSFYLFHGTALIVFCDQIGPHLPVLPELLRFIVLFVGSFALSVAAALVSYALFERPYFQHKRRTEIRVRPSLGDAFR